MGGRLEGRTAIVTGAGQGIGAAIATRFCEQGARVIIAELNPDTAAGMARTLTGAGHQALGIQTDVADAASVAAMVDAAVAAWGPPDILVNNAGIAVFSDPLKLTAEDWRRCFAVDLDGVWHASQAVLPHMLTAGRGSIVNIASVHSWQIIPSTFPYPVAKHGLLGLTRALAIEYASKGIRVNAICPAYVATQVAEDYWATFPDPAAEKQRAADLHPVKRIATTDEIAWPAVFLASDEASFVTGASLMVDGGITLLVNGHG
jgi:NAD(P)-dependent dehydrogenase (short-subunit alcohol dehydrogenase family)